MVNINTATEVELQVLPGIGPRRAATVVAHRRANGPFESVDQLHLVNGIGPQIFQQIQALVTV